MKSLFDQILLIKYIIKNVIYLKDLNFVFGEASLGVRLVNCLMMVMVTNKLLLLLIPLMK